MHQATFIGELVISSTSAGNESMVVYLKGNKPCLNTVARALG